MHHLNLNIAGQRVAGYPPILKDGNTVAWYDSQLLSTITKDGSDFVSRWNDRLLSGRDLIQATGAAQPKWFSVNGILFDGIDDFLKTAAFTFNQPEMIYIVFKQATWTDTERIFDGNSSNAGMLLQRGVTPDINIYAGVHTPINSNLAVNTYGIARVLFNGATSSLQINQTTKQIANAGANNMGGFTLGAIGAAISSWSNIQVKEIILRKVADTVPNETLIYNYLSKKYGI